MKTSDHVDKIVAAIAKGQTTLENQSKDSKNPHLKSKFLSLARGTEYIRSVFAPLGVAINQSTELRDNLLVMQTRLSLADQWIETEYPVATLPAKPQELGAAMTYSRRYSLFALVGMVGDEDDDAESIKNTAITNNLMSVDESRKARDEMLADIVKCTTNSALLAWTAKTDNIRKQLHKADLMAVRDAYSEQQTAIKGA